MAPITVAQGTPNWPLSGGTFAVSETTTGPRVPAPPTGTVWPAGEDQDGGRRERRQQWRVGRWGRERRQGAAGPPRCPRGARRRAGPVAGRLSVGGAAAEGAVSRSRGPAWGARVTVGDPQPLRERIRIGASGATWLGGQSGASGGMLADGGLVWRGRRRGVIRQRVRVSSTGAAASCSPIAGLVSPASCAQPASGGALRQAAWQPRGSSGWPDRRRRGASGARAAICWVHFAPTDRWFGRWDTVWAPAKQRSLQDDRSRPRGRRRGRRPRPTSGAVLRGARRV